MRSPSPTSSVNLPYAVRAYFSRDVIIKSESQNLILLLLLVFFLRPARLIIAAIMPYKNHGMVDVSPASVQRCMFIPTIPVYNERGHPMPCRARKTTARPPLIVRMIRIMPNGIAMLSPPSAKSCIYEL